MSMKYYNPIRREHARIDKMLINRKPLYCAIFNDDALFFETAAGAKTQMLKRGYYAYDAYAQNPTYKINHYSITVKNGGHKPGESVDVLIQSDRPSAKYVYQYKITWFIGDNTLDIANLALYHYKLWANRTVKKLPIQKD